MAGPFSFILGAVILTALFAGGGAVLWLVFGRKKRGEDKAIGVLEQMAHFKATSSMDAVQRRVR